MLFRFRLFILLIKSPFFASRPLQIRELAIPSLGCVLNDCDRCETEELERGRCLQSLIHLSALILWKEKLKSICCRSLASIFTFSSSSLVSPSSSFYASISRPDLFLFTGSLLRDKAAISCLRVMTMQLIHGCTKLSPDHRSKFESRKKTEQVLSRQKINSVRPTKCSFVPFGALFKSYSH